MCPTRYTYSQSKSETSAQDYSTLNDWGVCNFNKSYTNYNSSCSLLPYKHLSVWAAQKNLILTPKPAQSPVSSSLRSCQMIQSQGKYMLRTERKRMKNYYFQWSKIQKEPGRWRSHYHGRRVLNERWWIWNLGSHKAQCKEYKNVILSSIPGLSLLVLLDFGKSFDHSLLKFPYYNWEGGQRVDWKVRTGSFQFWHSIFLIHLFSLRP